MSETGRPKKHRHKRHYTFMIISGDSDGSSESFHLGHVATQVLAFLIFAIIVALICFVINSAITVSSLKDQNAKLSVELAELEETNASLASVNSELQSEVTQLSQAINQKVEAEAQTAAEAEELSLPTLLPISNGTASMESTYDDPDSTEIPLPEENAGADAADDENADENTDDADETAEADTADEGGGAGEGEEATDDTAEEAEQEPVGDPILIIKAEVGSTVIAAGAGTVASVTADLKYGNVITIDHGNGYTSIYRNPGDSLVHEGDTVARGATLIVISEDNTTLGYQIKSGEEFINPEDLIEING